MIRYSRYNIFSKIRESQNYFIINLLTGNADIITPADAENVQMILDGKLMPDEKFSEEMAEKVT